ncbi:MAG: YaaR family protein [Heliobacteriaceae bacterium]|nr:YaaR family protein [Heliobacteriaceae bacterium]MDD4588505.1 YaaR family protein [Heliobacteriaceae bacterium]
MAFLDVKKIEKTTPVDTPHKVETPGEKVSFTEVMHRRREELDRAKLDKLIAQIDDQGQILANTRTVEDLKHYKALVKKFLADAVKHALRVEERRGFNRRGRAKIYKTVAKVDEKLLALTDAVLKKQAKSLQILELVGEIKGLLVDIYA